MTFSADPFFIPLASIVAIERCCIIHCRPIYLRIWICNSMFSYFDCPAVRKASEYSWLKDDYIYIKDLARARLVKISNYSSLCSKSLISGLNFLKLIPKIMLQTFLSFSSTTSSSSIFLQVKLELNLTHTHIYISNYSSSCMKAQKCLRHNLGLNLRKFNHDIMLQTFWVFRARTRVVRYFYKSSSS